MTGIVQSTYGLSHNPAYAGMVADGELANIISKLNSDTVTIPYGKAVFADGEGAAKLPTSGSTADQFAGVAVRELNRAYGMTDTFGAVIDKDFSVLTAGVIWVTAAEQVTARGKVFVRVGATGNGNFAAAAGADATLAVEIPGAKYITSGAAGALVKVSFVVGG